MGTVVVSWGSGRTFLYISNRLCRFATEIIKNIKFDYSTEDK